MLSQPHRSFSETAANYIEHRGDKRYLLRIVDRFENRALASIQPFDIYQMAESLYPNAINATRNPTGSYAGQGGDDLWNGYERG
jgi:hypothetical protein